MIFTNFTLQPKYISHITYHMETTAKSFWTTFCLTNYVFRIQPKYMLGVLAVNFLPIVLHKVTFISHKFLLQKQEGALQSENPCFLKDLLDRHEKNLSIFYSIILTSSTHHNHMQTTTKSFWPTFCLTNYVFRIE